MSTASVPCPCVAALNRADRSAGALVMSISSGAVTTGTPLITSTGKLPSCICVTSCGRGHGCAGRPLVRGCAAVHVRVSGWDG